MSNIDERIVDMRFENKQFESNIQTSMNSIGKLKESLNFTESSKGLDNLENAGRSFSLSAVGNAIDTISSKFNALSVIGITALANIANSAVNAAKNMVSSFTLGPITSGFREYELKMNSIQTILANTQNGTKKAVKGTVDAINATGAATVGSIDKTNKASTDSLKRTQSQQIRSYNRTAAEEIRVVDKKYKKELDALEEAIDKENEKLKEAHNQKLEMYNKEYMEKLKLMDEEKYNKIKAIDDEINGINAKTKAEEDAIKDAEEKKKLADLENRVASASGFDERETAEQDLADYKAELDRERLLAEREAQIGVLETQKDDIETIYDVKEEEAKKEYDTNVDNENKIYEESVKFTKKRQEAEIESLNEIREAEKTKLRDRQASELDAIRERQGAELDAMKQVQGANSGDGTGTESVDPTTLEEVNAALDELNTYADKTIYNFSEMTRNIGTFTAAGVDLDTSVNAIKGIANLSAVSGSNAEQASRAMYQLSQALAAGKVQLMDWNSVTYAGIGGQVFQDALKDTARVHGIAIDDIIAKEGSFRESLQTGWLSSDILTETLSKFTGDLTAEQLKTMGYTDEQIKGIIELGKTANDAATKVKTYTQLVDTLRESASSGWATSWEIIIGDFGEAKELFTTLGDSLGSFVNESSNARNEMLKFWDDNGGRKAIIDGLISAFKGLESIIKPIGEAFREIFPRTTGQQLVDMSNKFKNLMANFKIGENTAKNLKSTFKGLFALLDIGKRFFSAIAKGIAGIVKNLLPAGDGVLSFTGMIGDWIVALDDVIKKSDIFNTVIKGFVDLIGKSSKNVGGAISSIVEWIKSLGTLDLSGFIQFCKTLWEQLEPFSTIGEVISKIFEWIKEAFEKLAPIFKKIGDGLASVFGPIWDTLTSIFKNATLDDAIKTLIGLLSGGLLAAIIRLVNSFRKVTDKSAGFVDSIIKTIDSVKACFEALQKDIEAKTLLKIAIAIGILSASLIALSFVDPVKLGVALAAISAMFGELLYSMSVVQKILKDKGFTGISKLIVGILGLSLAVLILSRTAMKFASLDWDQVAKGVIGTGALIAVLAGATKLMSKADKTKMGGAYAGLILLSTAVWILSSVVKKLGELDTDKAIQGVAAVGVILEEFALFMKYANTKGIDFKKGLGFIGLSMAMKTFAGIAIELGKLDPKQLGQGLAGLAAVLGSIVLFTREIQDSKILISTGLALVVIATAMSIFSDVIAKMGGLNLEQIGKGLLTMAGALASVTLATRYMPDNMVNKGLGLVSIAIALMILYEAISKMGNLNTDQITKGLVTMAASLATVVLTLKYLDDDALRGAAALIVVSLALTVLAGVLKLIGGMSWGDIAKGLIALAASFAIIGGAAYFLEPLIPALYALSGVVAILGVGCLAAGLGLLAFSAGLAALAVSGGAGILVLITGLKELIGLIPEFFKKIGEGIVEVLKTIGNSADAIKDALLAIIKAALETFTESIPMILDVFFKLIIGILDELDKNIPEIVDKLFSIVIGFLKKVAENLPELIKTGAELIKAFFQGVMEAIGAVDLSSLLESLGSMVVVMAVLATFAVSAIAAAKGIVAITALLALLGAIKQIPGLAWLINEGGEFLSLIGKAIGELIGGLIGGVLDGISNSLPNMANKLSQFMDNLKPFLDGAKTIDKSTVDGIMSLVKVILAITAASVFDSLTSWLTGGSAITKFGEDLAEFGVSYNKYYNSIKGIDGSIVQASANAAKVLAEFASTIPNSGGLVAIVTGENSITQFADELEKFGPKLMSYANSVKGLDADVVVNSANAAKVLTEVANNVPDQGGIVDWFAGSNSLSQFAEELTIFGPKLMTYSESVKGLDSDVVLNSANAAKVLSEMANNLPDQGGLISWLAGDNSITTFADQLISFGPKLMTYAESVRGLDSNVVLNSANAAKVLSEMADNLPDQGGVVDWFAGSNSIAAFGEELVKFGPTLKRYADSIVGLDPNVVNNSATAATTLSTLANQLPNTGGVGSWFSGDNNISNFGNDLVSFGRSLTDYSNSLVGVDFALLSKAGDEVKGLIDIAKGMKDVDSVTISNFGYNLTSLGNNGLEGFISAFTGSSERVTSAMEDMLDYASRGVENNQDKPISKMTTMVASMIKVIPTKRVDMVDAMSDMVDGIVDAIVIKTTAVSAAGVTLVTSVISAIRLHIKDFKTIGEDIDSSIIDGIKSKQEDVVKAVVEMIKSAYEASRKELGINSPSKAFRDLGMYSAMGFSNGIKSFSNLGEKEANRLGEDSIKSLSGAINKIYDIINTDIDMTPVIRPVIDLTDVEDGSKRLSALLSKNKGINVSAIRNNLPNYEHNKSGQNGTDLSSKQNSSGSSVQFNQYNYSPKSLSRIEIYRQTKNQISSLKELMLSV